MEVGLDRGEEASLDHGAIAGRDCGAVHKTMGDQPAMVEPVEMGTTRAEPVEEMTTKPKLNMAPEQKTLWKSGRHGGAET